MVEQRQKGGGGRRAAQSPHASWRRCRPGANELAMAQWTPTSASC